MSGFDNFVKLASEKVFIFPGLLHKQDIRLNTFNQRFPSHDCAQSFGIGVRYHRNLYHVVRNNTKDKGDGRCKYNLTVSDTRIIDKS